MLMLSTRGVAGLGAASPTITELQNALIALAQASGRPSINPGKADGILGPMTMNAVAAGLAAAAEKIPKDSVAKALAAALALGATSSQAMTAVNSYAPQLTILIKSATVAFAAGVLKPQTIVPMTVVKALDPQITMNYPVKPTSIITAPVPTTPWFKTWWGIGSIAVGTFALIFLLLPKKTAAASAGTAGPGGLGMTKADALTQFNELYPPESFKSRGYIDRPMRDQAWNDYTDSLQRDRQITMKQYESWSSPWRD